MGKPRKKNGHYYAEVFLYRDSLTGKPQYHREAMPEPEGWEKWTDAKKDKYALKWYADVERRAREGSVLKGTKVTLKDFYDRWMVEYAPQHLSPKTIEDYSAEFRKKILPAFGHRKLTEIRPAELNAWLNSLAKDGARQDGKPGGYSKGTIVKIQNAFSSLLHVAADWELIDKNPMDKVRLHLEREPEKLKYWTPEQFGVFLDFIEQPYKIKTAGHKRVDDTGKPYTVGDYETTGELSEQLRVLFILAIVTGMRKGEIIALEWSDIDFEESTVNVTKSTARVNGQQITKAPKTANSVRAVPIPRTLAQRLRRLKLDRIQYRLKVGSYWEGAEWVFIQDNGKQMDLSTPLATLKKMIGRYNEGKAPADQLPDIPFHALRHTSATALIAKGVDTKTVSGLLGHAQTSTTMNIYAHALAEKKREAADLFEEMLSKQA